MKIRSLEIHYCFQKSKLLLGQTLQISNILSNFLEGRRRIVGQLKKKKKKDDFFEVVYKRLPEEMFRREKETTPLWYL